jgi:hypothetical protein
MNVVILGIIVIVVLIVVLVFFVGGTAQVTSRIKDVFSGRISAQAVELAISDCQQLCPSAKSLPPSLQGKSGYCTKTFLVSLDGKTTKAKCGSDSKVDIEVPTDEEKSRGVDPMGLDLGQRCIRDDGTPLPC